MVSLSLLSMLAVLLIIPITMSLGAAATAASKERSHGAVRDVTQIMRAELETAASNIDLIPFGVDQIEVTLDGAPVAAGANGNEVTFRVPTADDADENAASWSVPITYRYDTEDTNGNSVLDNGEDDNDDDRLDRWITRLQDLNGDGDNDDGGETRIIGGTGSVSAMAFSLNNEGDILSIDVSGTDALDRSETIDYEEGRIVRTISTRLRTQIYIQN